MNLSGPADFAFDAPPFLARLERATGPRRFLARCIAGHGPAIFELSTEATDAAEVQLSPELGYLNTGDILRLHAPGRAARVLYRRESRHNFLFFTERCNSRCLMCSQPPRDADDGQLVEDILQMIPWMDPATAELGITGGEPTLLGEKLIEVLAAAKRHLPQAAVHVLTNGRLLCRLPYARQLAAVNHPDLMLGVPLYADHAAAHDFVVQAAGAFEDTIFGLLNLARVGVRVEIRVVVHRETYRRLPQLARFVARNLPFASQVALMGLELTGYARSNLSGLWIDPADYQDELEIAVTTLTDAGLSVFLFNHPLCVLRPSLHPYARKSISDWKNVYLPECEACLRRSECGGFFASGTLRRSQRIRPFLSPTAR